MEQLFISLLSGELTVTALLLLFIISLLTKRFVPWWVYEAMEERLKLYEKEAPGLIRDVKKLLQEIDEAEEEATKKESTRNVALIRRPKHGNSRNRPKKGGSDDSSRISS